MRFFTAGESHGPKLTAIIEGLPSHLHITAEQINEQLKRRQGGYGRGRRMQIEKDLVEISSGVRHGETLGSPVTLTVTNDDWKHWTGIMGIEPLEEDIDPDEIKRQISRPRPGHADLVGGIKYDHRDLRNVLERSSARETTMRVAIGAVAMQVLHQLDIQTVAHVTEIGGIVADPATYESLSVEELRQKVEASPVYCADDEAAERMMRAIDEAKERGDTLGGVVEVVIFNCPPGVGSYVQFDRKMDGKLAQAMMSINAFKGVEFGIGFQMAKLWGSEVHDEIIWDEANGYTRRTNRLGGLEGGMTTGMPIVVRGVMKPIPTLYKPLESVDIHTKEPFVATIERSDPCAVPAASVVAEHVIATEMAKAMIEQYHSDTMGQLKRQVEEMRTRGKEF